MREQLISVKNAREAASAEQLNKCLNEPLDFNTNEYLLSCEGTLVDGWQVGIRAISSENVGEGCEDIFMISFNATVELLYEIECSVTSLYDQCTGLEQIDKNTYNAPNYKVKVNKANQELKIIKKDSNKLAFYMDSEKISWGPTKNQTLYFNENYEDFNARLDNLNQTIPNLSLDLLNDAVTRQ